MVWGVRSSRTDLDRCGWSWRACHRVESRLARFADLVISNSAAGLERAVASGFPRATLRVVPSGINVERFYPDAQAGAAVRAQWDLRRDHCLIGLVGRLDPREDHPVFLRAAALLASPAYYPHHSPGR